MPREDDYDAIAARRNYREMGKALRDYERQKGIDPYVVHKELMAEKRREMTKIGRDIGEIPPIKDRARRQAGIDSFIDFCNIYLPDQFTLAWSKYHYRAAEKIQRAVDEGGLYAFAMPRGSGKTTLSRAGVLWAVLSGRTKCVVLLAAAEYSAQRHLKYGLAKTILRNPLLLDDFPHAIYPFRKIDGQAKATTGQLYKGDRTFIEWHAAHITFAWIPEEDSLSSGSVIETMGMTAEIRGPLYTQPDGTQIRPTLVLADDPQTRESARSVSQSQSRLETLCGDVAYLAGPAHQIAVVCPCTVIYDGDLADQILNRDLHPEWQGERTKMVESFPINMDLWDRYADILRQSQREDAGLEACTDFYIEHREPMVPELESMDYGAVVSWPERFRDNEVSAIQHAMNLRFRDEAAFFSECQNEPIMRQDDMELIAVDDLVRKTTFNARGAIPNDCSVLTAFTDVQLDHLFWMVIAWTPDFTGYVIDYGAWPEQKQNYFTRSTVRKKLSHLYDGDESGITFGAFTALGNKLCGGKYTNQNGNEVPLGRWCIDANWRQREAAIKAYADQSPYRAQIALTYGRGIRATQRPFDISPKALKYKTGPAWYWDDRPGAAKPVVFDANVWKKRIHNALLLAIGSRGSIQLFKAEPSEHRMLADHLLSEKPVRNEALGRTVYEWQLIPNRDNEGLDCMVGCAIGAAICGVSAPSERITRSRTIVKSAAEWAAAAKAQ